MEKTCEHCGNPFDAKRDSAKYCTPGCRTAAWSAKPYRDRALAAIRMAQEMAEAAEADCQRLREDRKGLEDEIGRLSGELEAAQEELRRAGKWCREHNLRLACPGCLVEAGAVELVRG